MIFAPSKAWFSPKIGWLLGISPVFGKVGHISAPRRHSARPWSKRSWIVPLHCRLPHEPTSLAKPAKGQFFLWMSPSSLWPYGYSGTSLEISRDFLGLHWDRMGYMTIYLNQIKKIWVYQNTRYPIWYWRCWFATQKIQQLSSWISHRHVWFSTGG